jgi:hypothetical protein
MKLYRNLGRAARMPESLLMLNFSVHWRNTTDRRDSAHGAISKDDMDIGEQGGTMKLPEIGTPPVEPSIGTELPPTPSSGVKCTADH